MRTTILENTWESSDWKLSGKGIKHKGNISYKHPTAKKNEKWWKYACISNPIKVVRTREPTDILIVAPRIASIKHAAREATKMAKEFEILALIHKKALLAVCCNFQIPELKSKQSLPRIWLSTSPSVQDGA